MAREFRNYEDVPLWIWTNAKVIADPHRQFRNIVRTFKGYPKPVLVRKIKHRWLPRLFFLVEGQPFPYAEKLMHLAPQTKLGKRFAPMRGRAVNLVTGKAQPGRNPWKRPETAFELLARSDLRADCRRLEDACAKAMLRAGVEPEWVKADYSNIDELLSRRLGAMP